MKENALLISLLLAFALLSLLSFLLKQHPVHVSLSLANEMYVQQQHSHHDQQQTIVDFARKVAINNRVVLLVVNSGFLPFVVSYLPRSLLCGN